MCEQCGCQHCHMEEEATASNPTAAMAAEPEFADPPIQRKIANPINPQERQTAILQMQRQQGNQAVRRLLQGSAPVGVVQPWAVNIPRDTACHEVPDLITQTSPYSPKWARAEFNFRFNSVFIASGTAPDFTLRPSNLNVIMTPNIDVPQWSPTNPTTAGQWTSAMTALNAHENVHRATATTWRTTIQDHLRAYRPTVTAATAREAEDQGQSVFQAEMDTQTALHQAAQDAIDANGAGCVAIMTCPVPAPTPDAGS